MQISSAMVKELRESTGAGMMECKKALVETNGDMEKAVDYLREKGLGKAAKKADRLASEGLVSIAINKELTKATVVEINSETDFVAKNAQFISLVENTAQHIQDKSIKTADELNASIINGVKFDENLKTQIATIGENIVVRRFATVEQSDGVLNGYIHSNNRVAVIISATCESADKSKVADFLRQLCMHAAAMKPQVISYKDLDKDFVQKEFIALKAELEKDNEELSRLGKPLHHIPHFASRLQLSDEVMKKATEDIKAELKAEGKPEKIWDHIIPGKIDRFVADNTILDQRLTLLGQFFVMDDKKTIEQVIEDKSKELGGKITITNYIRFEVGEGLEKKSEDFAAEVAAQIG
ncbi:elongation factor Ts [Campylobacter sp. RM12327]|uniref:translation elongation factor Ts n=1 Tax=Campylobacter sputorum TaxID=206 RepID=UPI000B76DB14|nr:MULTISPECIES: translation elongation factor Ts [Campylobacter]ASM39712.1 translation elongation factor EF-Ts [Campylobacter sputorum]MBE7358088.1 elongation factor Ts [Campylobacter sp. RM11302]MBF6668900.1 elongation factor Ts [Campylobacter sp. RM12327]MBF6673814.1 elongation factor Ts [Campylobacter sp. RM13538]MBF6676282.1 elongation factor Ts [Campylobacter sp. RM12321]